MNKNNSWLTIILTLFSILSIHSCKNGSAIDTFDGHAKYLSDLTDSAESFYLRGDRELAIQYHKRALKFAQENNQKKAQAHALLQIAKMLPKQDADTSLQYLKSALKIARSIQHYELQTNIYRSIAEIHKQQHDYSSAIYALEAQNLLTDSLMEERRIKDMNLLKTERNALEERYLGIGIVGFSLTLAVLFSFIFVKTKKLNTKLMLSIDVRNKLFSIISHDLRGPAGSIKKAHDLIDSGAISIEELPPFIKMLRNQSDMLNETLDSLLLWSRSQLEEIQTNPTRFDIFESITKTLILLEGQWVNKDIVIKNNIQECLFLCVDKNQFEFIIRNVISNAIKFSHIGGTIELDLNAKTDVIAILITDHGAGISPERQKQFYSGNLETTFGTSGEKGTGLGLRMVLDFMLSIGGKIHLKSISGLTSFELIFPTTEVCDDEG